MLYNNLKIGLFGLLLSQGCFAKYVRVNLGELKNSTLEQAITKGCKGEESYFYEDFELTNYIFKATMYLDKKFNVLEVDYQEGKVVIGETGNTHFWNSQDEYSIIFDCDKLVE